MDDNGVYQAVTFISHLDTHVADFFAALRYSESMDSDRMKERICENAAEIVRLHSRIHETLAQRSKSSERKREWELACAEFHARYEGLAFPGGYRGALDRISSGDTEAMEAAICFLECRPYFFSFRLHVQGHSASMQTSTVIP